jgi:hypothetical protein
MRLLILLTFVVLFCASNAGADCKTDCEQEFKTATQECKTTYNDPDSADQLQECLDQARTDYDSCLDECRDEWDDETER